VSCAHTAMSKRLFRYQIAPPSAIIQAIEIFGIAGHSGMGKTTLLERLVPEISSRGLVVSLIKHSHKHIDIDRPGKDSYRLRESGCKEVLLLGNDRWALMHELRGAAGPQLDYLLERMQHCDLMLIEGFKGGGFPKLEVWQSAVGKPTLWPEWLGIVAIACDTPLAAPDQAVGEPGVTRLDLSDTASIAAFVLLHGAGLNPARGAGVPEETRSVRPEVSKGRSGA
jgi:molybdopterin-guanine dinucleotide biosynthesis adapter protein